MLKVGYYILALLIGFAFSILVRGSSVATFHFLDGQLVEERMTDVSFIRENALRLQTKTVVDYDGLLWMFSGRTSDLLPRLTFEGGFGTPATVNIVLIAVNTTGILLLFWGLRRAYFAMRRQRSREQS